MKIDDYINILKEAKERGMTENEGIAILQELGKDARMHQINDNKQEYDPDAWRNEPASERQKKMMDYKKILYKPNITKGEASDLIDLHTQNKEEKVPK